MALFELIEVIDGNTIKTSGWKWKNEYTGNIIKILGYKIPTDSVYQQYAMNKLTNLLEGKSFELKNVKDVKETPEGNVISCSVLLDGVDISTYFGDVKTV